MIVVTILLILTNIYFIYKMLGYKKLLSAKPVSNKRKALFNNDFWYLDTPNETWVVTFTLIETGEKTSTKTKFDIFDVSSANLKDTQKNIEYYKKHFISSSNGGWLSNTNPKLEWLIDKTKSEIREEKIRKVLSKEEGLVK